MEHHLPPSSPPDQQNHQSQQKQMEEKKHAPPPKRNPPPPSPPPESPYYSRNTAHRSICKAISIFFLLVGLTVLILWLIYRPQKPQFTVLGAAIYDLNTTSPPFISTSMQFTIVAHNPNKRISIIYDKLSAYVTYKNQMITPPVTLPPLYQETRSTVAMAPVLGGAGVPVAAEVVNGLVMDEGYGVVAFRVVVLGRLRWKAGVVKTGRYGVYVRCDVWVGIKRGGVGQVPLLGSPKCKVDV